MGVAGCVNSLLIDSNVLDDTPYAGKGCKMAIAKKANAVLPCKYPFTLNMRHPSGSTVPFPATCGWCYGCTTTKKNDLIGRVGAEALLCTRVDFITGTYDDKRGIESNVSAKIRNVTHPQKFQKVLRQREARGLKAYNRRETALAETEGREPKLVDATRSYIKFLVVHEFGSKKTKRSHWHMMIFWLSHFEIDPNLIETGDISQSMPAAKRVWDIERILGPITPKRPPDAANPDVIDCRVLTDANQEWGAWPHGQVNYRCITHDTVTGAMKRPENLMESVKYVSKYLYKSVYEPKGRDPARQSAWHHDRASERFQRDIKSNVNRTASRGIGHAYATIWAEKRANVGVQLHDMQYQLRGFTMKRDHASVYKHQQSLRMKGVNDVATLENLTDNRLVFEMRGAMRTTAFKAYYDARTKRLGRNPRPTEIGDTFVKELMRLESAEFTEWLGSQTAIMARMLQPHKDRGRAPLPNALPPIHVFDVNEKGELLDGRMRREKRFRKPADRLAERRADIENIKAQYAQQRPIKGKVSLLKKLVSETPVHEMLTEWLYQNRPQHIRHRFKREIDRARITHVLVALDDKAEKDPEAKEQAQWLRDFDRNLERDMFDKPRNDLWHSVVGRETLWSWVNTSDDYNLPELREHLVMRFCRVHWLDDKKRVIFNPRGDVFIQRKTTVKKACDKTCPVTGDVLRVQSVERWATRKAESPEQREAAISGQLSNRSAYDRDAIFYGERPLRVSASTKI